MTRKDDDQAARLERARAIGLFRCMLIREAADPVLTGRQRGAMVRAIAAAPHTDPDGRTIRITRWTLDRWIQAESLRCGNAGLDHVHGDVSTARPATTERSASGHCGALQD